MAEPQETIPYARFTQEIAKRTALEEQIKALELRLGGIEEAHNTALKAVTDERDAAVGALTTERLDMDVDRTLISEGVTEQGVEYFRYKYSQIAPGEDGSKPTFSDWFTGYKAESAAMVTAFKKPEAVQEPTTQGGAPTQPVAKPAEPAKPATPVATPQPTQYAWQRPAAAKPTAPVVDPGAAGGGPSMPKGAPDFAAVRDMSPEDFATTMKDMGWVK